MGGDGEAPAAPAWWPAGGISRPPSPPAWWPEGGINPPARGGDARTVGRDGGPNREDDDGEESLAAESHVRWPEEKTSPSPRRTSSDADPLGAPVVVRNTSGTRASPADNDRATDRGRTSLPQGLCPTLALDRGERLPQECVELLFSFLPTDLLTFPEPDATMHGAWQDDSTFLITTSLDIATPGVRFGESQEENLQIGSTNYIFTAGLKTKQPANKWILAGVSLFMDVES